MGIDDYFDSPTSPGSETDEKSVPVLGIDLGTTHSCLAVWRRKSLEIIPDEFGHRTIPSVVAFTNRSTYIGREAKRQIEMNPDGTYYDIKRLIGRRFDDPSINLDREFLSYSISEADSGAIRLDCSLKNRKPHYTPEELSALILLKLKGYAEEYLGESVEQVVITVPAYFNDSQREATRDAAEIAGLNCLRIINEPTAAALAYGMEKRSHDRDEMNLIVYDLGGGTLDVSLLNIADGVFEVLASTGNTHLGGEDFDHRLMKYALSRFRKQYRIPAEKLQQELPATSLERLKSACETAKKLLSTTSSAPILVRNFFDGKKLALKITRTEFEKICGDLFIMCLKSVEDVLKSADVERDEIDEVILVGGATRMRRIRENISLYFHGLEPNTNVNADEVVAAGAAIQGHLLTNENDPFTEKMVLLDIVPLSLGVEVIGGVMNTLIPRNSVIPIKRRRKYTTDTDDQTEVVIKVFEGERKMTADNFQVGEFTLSGLEPGPRGYAQLEVTFAIDLNGIITVKAIDLRNEENENAITINSNKGRLTLDQIKILVEEAEAFAISDKARRMKKQLYYEIDDLASNIEANLHDEDCQLKERDRERVETEVKQITDWLREKSYLDRDPNEYRKLIQRIKQKYRTLILRSPEKGVGVEAAEGGVSGTTVFGDEEDEKTVYERLGLDDDQLDGVTEVERQELLNSRQTLLELCYSVLDLLRSDRLRLETDEIDEIRDYLDDLLLWTHVHEKIGRSEYLQKIDELNQKCNELVDREQSVFEEVTEADSHREEVEQLCYGVLSSLSSNLFAADEERVSGLKALACESLDRVVELELDRNEKNGESIDQQYTEMVDRLNQKCEELYQSMVPVDTVSGSVFADPETVVVKPETSTSSIDETIIERLERESAPEAELGMTLEQLRQQARSVG